MIIEYRFIIRFTQGALAFRHLLKYRNHNLDKTCCCWKSCFWTVEEEDKSNIHFLTPLQTCLNLVFVPRHRFPFVPLLAEIEALQQEERLKHKIGRNGLDLFTFLLMSGGWPLSRFMSRISQFDKDASYDKPMSDDLPLGPSLVVSITKVPGIFQPKIWICRKISLFPKELLESFKYTHTHLPNLTDWLKTGKSFIGTTAIATVQLLLVSSWRIRHKEKDKEESNLSHIDNYLLCLKFFSGRFLLFCQCIEYCVCVITMRHKCWWYV